MDIRRKIAILLAVCMVMFTFAACGKENDSDNNDSHQTNETNGQTKEVNNTLTDEDELYEEFFDINNTISIQLEISKEQLDRLQQDYIKYDTMNSKSPIYRMADKAIITIDDQVFEMEEVGIRLKGNTSRVPVYDRKTGELNLSHYKLSFNETFDDKDYYGDDAKVWSSDVERQARKDRRFATLKKLEVKWNKNYDDTHIREYCATEIFREAGVLAQRINLCSFGVNGENYGVVNIYEPVDELFIERNLPQEDWGGDLYKCGWTFRPANYIEDSVTYGIQDKDAGKFYNYDLKTNKKDSNHSFLEKLLEVLNREDVSQEEFESVIDTDYLVNFLAASYFMGDPDDIRNNYNNHYIYFLKSSGKAIFIPYDNDRCLGLTYGWNPEYFGMTDVSPYSDMAEGNQREQSNPIIIYSVLEDGYYIDEYTEALKKVAGFDDWKQENFEKIYNVAKDHYESVCIPTVDFANVKGEFKFRLEGEFTTEDDANMSFEEYVETIMDTFHSEVKE